MTRWKCRAGRRSILGRLAVLALVGWFCLQDARAGEPAATRSSLPKVRVAADGRTFVTADGKPFVPIGVNYYRPGTGWAPQLWKKFDAEATRRDFARMKQLGVNCVRVFLTYGSFFMGSDSLGPDGLAKFDQLLAIAEEAGIYIHPTGPDHWEGLPPWARGDRIADDRVLEALEGFWRLFAGRYRQRSVIFAYDLLNEPQVPWDTPAMRTKWNQWLEAENGTGTFLEDWVNLLAPESCLSYQKCTCPVFPPAGRQLLDYQHFREEIADQWTRRQAAAIKSADPQALVTVGLIQSSVPAVPGSPRQYAAFRPQRQAQWLDFMEVHFYPLAAGFYDYTKPEDEDRNLAYLESVVREAAAPGKPVVLAEFGWYGGGKLSTDRGVHPAASDQQQARWCRRVIETTEGLATGWLNWGFYDHPEARDCSQLSGLLTADGRPKAWARQFESLARRLAGKAIPPAKTGPRPALDWDQAITDPKASEQFRDAYYRAFQADRGGGGLPTCPAGIARAAGSVRYVSPSGSDQRGDGSRANPWQSIRHATDRVPDDGSTVILLPGLYTGTQSVGRHFQKVCTVRAERPYAARLRSPSTNTRALWCYDCSNVAFEGLELFGSGSTAGEYVVHVGSARAHHIVFEDCIIHDSFQNDLVKVNDLAHHVTFRGCLFFNPNDHAGDEHLDINTCTDIAVEDSILLNDYAGSGRAPAGGGANQSHSFIVIKNSGSTPNVTRRIALRRNVFLGWQGRADQAYVLLGEDGKPFDEAQQVTIENNLFIHDSPVRTWGTLLLKGGLRDVTFRANTVVGHPVTSGYSGAMAAMLLRIDKNPPMGDMLLANNIWCDPTGRMPRFADGDARLFEPNSKQVIRNNLYWNAGKAIPYDASDVFSPARDPKPVFADPRLGSPARRPALPRWDAAKGEFLSGQKTIRGEFERLVAQYGSIPADSPAAHAADPSLMPADDILGRPRGPAPDIGCFESAAGR